MERRMGPVMDEGVSLEDRKVNDKRIVVYLAFTFILTFGIEIFLIMPMAGNADIRKAFLAQILVTGMMFLPALGVVFTRLVTKEGFQFESLMIAFRLKGNLRYYGLAWFGFAFLIFFGAALYFLIFPKHFDPDMGYAKALLGAQMQAGGAAFTDEQIKLMVWVQLAVGIIIAPFANFLPCFGEEWGWRGYLFPRLLNRFGAVHALLAEGLIWGLWHTPLIVMGHNYGVGYLGFPVTGILAMCIFCTVIGIILSYMTMKTKSCIPAVIGHGTINGLAQAGIYYTSLENPYNVFLGPVPVGLIGGAGFILVAAGLLYHYYKEEK